VHVLLQESIDTHRIHLPAAQHPAELVVVDRFGLLPYLLGRAGYAPAMPSRPGPCSACTVHTSHGRRVQLLSCCGVITGTGEEEARQGACGCGFVRSWPGKEGIGGGAATHASLVLFCPRRQSRPPHRPAAAFPIWQFYYVYRRLVFFPG